jgi:hypothetical protein
MADSHGGTIAVGELEGQTRRACEKEGCFPYSFGYTFGAVPKGFVTLSV